MSLSIVLLYYKAEFLGQYSEQGPKNLGIKWPKIGKQSIAICFKIKVSNGKLRKQSKLLLRDMLKKS